MDRIFPGLVVVLTLLSSAQRAPAGVSYPDPQGGWSFIYTASPGEDVAGDGASFDALDGTWSHTNGSDEWDGSAPGGTLEAGVNSPGGAKVFEEGGVSFLRIQDTGDPRDFGYADPGSNRKVYLGHDISQHGATENVLDQGVTISFRARIPTPGKTIHPLDPLHRDGQGAAGVQPYPAGGDGYVTSDGGKGNFVIKQASGGAFAFSLAVTDDQGQGDPNSPKAGFTGLTMNEFNGNAISANVNFGQGTATNLLALDPTEWHEFWIVLRKDPANIGTHEALIYVDGTIEARFFKITAGNGDDYGGIGYIAMGSTATPQNSALDVDFYAIKTEAVFPPGALANLPPEIRDLTPERGARYVPAANGLYFTGVTQAPNSIETTGARLILNGQDVSAGLVASGDIRNRTFTYGQLIPNQLYVGSAIVSDQTGRSSTNAVNFDTFVANDVVRMDFTAYADDLSLPLPSGRYHVYLFAGSTGPQTVRADLVTGQTALTLGTFLLSNTGALTSGLFSPLADAHGQPIVVTSSGGTTTLRLTQIYGGNSAPLEILAAPTTDAAPSGYVAMVLPPPGASVLPDAAIRAELVQGSGSIDANSIHLFVNDVDVTSQAVQTPRSDGVSIGYVPAQFFDGGVTPAARVTFTSGGATREVAWGFTVATSSRLPTSWATPASSVSGRPRGFTGRIHVARQDADGTLFPNNPVRATDQLADRIIDPDTGMPFLNQAGGATGDGSFVETETTNYEQNGGTAGEVGIPGDRTFPNLDALDWNYIALETVAYLDLPRGAQRMAVACDDGFVVWAGPSAAQTTNQVGIRSPGGSTLETTFDVLVEQAGVYAFRLLYFEGNGGADLEWYTVHPDTGQRFPINAPLGVQAYQSRTGDGSGEETKPTISVTRDGANVRVTWTGTLESANAVTGVWEPEAGATSPASFPVSGVQKYFRSRR